LHDDELRDLLMGIEADLVIVGHSHRPLDRTVEGVRVINLGSVSNPPGDDKRATWVEIEATTAGYRVERRWARYDLPEVRNQMMKRQVPSWSYVRRYFNNVD
jgi:diadenosine tetraphosphatase ApaH/serine/threonine PP2A family protein phosphatase